jgi:hypothetical protein
MVALTLQEREHSAQQTLASWAIEGFVPCPQYMALLDRYIAGELSLIQVSAITDAEFGIDTTSSDRHTTAV